MITVIDDNRELGINTGFWSTREKVFLNKEQVSAKWSVGGTLHLFTCQGEQSIDYEVETALRWHWLGKYVTVRRNGKVVFTNK